MKCEMRNEWSQKEKNNKWKKEGRGTSGNNRYLRENIIIT